MFKIGQKVVCIDDSFASDEDGRAYLPCWIKHGEVYTVRSIHVEDHIEGYGVRLEEIVNPSYIWSNGEECEWSFCSDRFVPLTISEKDVEAIQSAD